MPSVTFPDLPAARAFCDALKKLAGVPDPVRFPGTLEVAEPRALEAGGYEVSVPRKGPLALMLDADPATLTKDAVDLDGKVLAPKRATAKELADVRAALDTAREVAPEERKKDADPAIRAKGG